MKQTLLIDGDVLVYQVASAVEQVINWGDDRWTLHSDMKKARQMCDTTVADWLEDTQCDAVRIAFSCKDGRYFRKDILREYKAHRTKGRKPVVYWPLREYVEATYTCEEKPGLEGDDILGLWCTSPKFRGKCVVCSIDKDMRTLPGKHYNPDTGEHFEVTAEQADRYWMTQALTGDASDGYKGCPKVGPVKAEKLLSETPVSGLWEKVKAAFRDAGLEGLALANVQVARILRHGDYNMRQGEVRLWAPS